jgi:release factor glutamine methyltransferase
MSAEQHVADVVAAAAQQLVSVSSSPRLDAELIVGDVLGLDRVGLRVHDDAGVAAEQAARIDALLARRAAGEPIAYLLGTAWFYGLELAVDARVLVPRPETELLVERALQHLAARHIESIPVVIDACTGSGCVAIAIAHELGDSVQVVATDISTEALEVAAANAERTGVSVTLVHGDLLSDIAGDTHAAVITANPPYVEGIDAHGLEPGVRDHEPHEALFVPSGEGVASFYGRLAAQAASRLEQGGILVVEHGAGQRQLVCGALEGAGLSDVHGLDDLAGIDRVVVATRP